jgi:5-carboxyvanillate decarboxylase
MNDKHAEFVQTLKADTEPIPQKIKGRNIMLKRKKLHKKQTDKTNAIDRRTALFGVSALAVSALAGFFQTASADDDSNQADRLRTGAKVRTIATEEAFVIPEIADELRALVKRGGTNLDLKLLDTIYNSPPPTDEQLKAATNPANRDAQSRVLLPKLLDIGAGRIAEMDARGVDVHLLSLAMPGVQMFETDKAVAFAKLSNDRLKEAIDRHPKRFAGLAAFAPQDPKAAAKEMERAINTLKLNGFLVNSHTMNRYLDEPQFYPILEAAEALGAPLYIHPRSPSDGMAAPFNDYRVEGAIWGYGAETGVHALRLMLSGALDRFPRLKIVLGHMGEALPFWMWRLDFMGTPGGRAGRFNKLKPSEYFKRNFAITTSGVEDPLALRFCIEKLGVESVMWAIDYPFQPTAPAVAFLENATLSDAERKLVAHGNAERIFKIKNN